MAQIRLFSEWVLAPAYLFDTSYLVALAIAGQPLHDESVGFFDRLVSDSAERRYLISPLAYAELANTSARIFLQADLGLAAAAAVQHLRENGPAAVVARVRQTLDVVADALDRLGDDVFQVRFDIDLWEKAADAMTANSLQPYDAIHLASARHARCEHIVTFDKGFERVPDIQIWRAF